MILDVDVLVIVRTNMNHKLTLSWMRELWEDSTDSALVDGENFGDLRERSTRCYRGLDTTGIFSHFVP